MTELRSLGSEECLVHYDCFHERIACDGVILARENAPSLCLCQVLESCIKNCGEGFYANVAHSKELLPEMVKIVTKKVSGDLVIKVREAFESHRDVCPQDF